MTFLQKLAFIAAGVLIGSAAALALRSHADHVMAGRSSHHHGIHAPAHAPSGFSKPFEAPAHPRRASSRLDV